MAMTREKAKGRKEGGRFFALPATVLNSPQLRGLSGSGTRVLLMLGEQYNGKNNGDLEATFNTAKKWGIGSQETLSRALADLMARELIIRTREGAFVNPGRKCALYALGWHPIDECKGKLDIAPTNAPPVRFG